MINIRIVIFVILILIIVFVFFFGLKKCDGDGDIEVVMIRFVLLFVDVMKDVVEKELGLLDLNLYVVCNDL